ncbi:high mobility group B protein 14 isoform X2 [Tanacetum coccineum]
MLRRWGKADKQPTAVADARTQLATADADYNDVGNAKNERCSLWEETDVKVGGEVMTLSRKRATTIPGHMLGEMMMYWIDKFSYTMGAGFSNLEYGYLCEIVGSFCMGFTGTTAVGKACGEKWKTMTYEEKIQYYDIATEKRAKFEKDMMDYVKKKENGEYDEFDEDSEYDD